jgi:hypothetical protein
MFIFLMMIFSTAFGQEWEPNPNFKFGEGVKAKYEIVGYRTIVKDSLEKVLYPKPLAEGIYFLAVSCFKIAGKDTTEVKFVFMSSTISGCPTDGFEIKAEDYCTVKYGVVCLTKEPPPPPTSDKTLILFMPVKHNEIFRR